MSGDAPFRIQVRVKPGARRAHVGGRWGEDDVLVVAVRAPAVGGRANDAVVAALAEAFGVGPRAVRIVSGPRARIKLVAIDDAPLDAAATLAILLAR